MFEVGFTEIILILGLALLVLGPEKLPGLAQKVGRWTGRARSMARQLRTQLEQEVTLAELAKSRTPQPSTEATSAKDANDASTDSAVAESAARTHEHTPDPTSAETRSHDAIDAGATAGSSEPTKTQQ